MGNPLFRNVQKALEEAAKQDATVRALSKAMGQIGTRSMMREARKLADNNTGTEVERYGRVADFVRQKIIAEVIRQLGPVGQILEALLRPNGQSIAGNVAQELDAAAGILEQLQPLEAPTAQRPRPQPGPMSSRRPQEEEHFRESTPAGFVDKQVIGRRYRFPDTDPAITGEMIDVQSSNVHSIGYEWSDENPSKGTLKVRFLEPRAKKAHTRAAGPLYFYYNVHPEVFLAFQHASSKGTFVWDRLRIRGTVSGSRYFYDLEDTGTSNHVPRKATRLGGNEYYLRRQMQNGQVSTLEDEFVQRIGVNRNGPQGFVPNRGTPNRGTPNRGRP